MDRIQLQASKLWDLLFSEDTAATYQATLTLTGTILKETAQLFWLIICSFFVFGAWFSDTTVKAGQSIRNWIEVQTSDTVSATEKKPLAQTGKSLLETTRTGIMYMLDQAREQLGIETSEAPSASSPSASSPASKTASQPVSQPAAKAVVTPPAAPSVSAEAPKPARANQPSDIDREEADDGWPQVAED